MMHYQSVFRLSVAGNRIVARMATAKGALFAAVGSNNPNRLKIFQLVNPGCRVWKDVTLSWKSQHGTYNIAMAEYQSDLYIGTDTGLVYQLAQHTIPKPEPVQLPSSIEGMAVFKSQLYAFTGNIHCTSNGVQWADQGPLAALGTNEQITGPYTSAVHNGYLYVGCGYKEGNPNPPSTNTKHGIMIFRSQDGTSWQLFKEMVRDMTAPVTNTVSFVPQHVHAMLPFGQHLYIGGYEGRAGTVYRTDGTQGSWDAIPAMPSGGVSAIEEHGSKIYIGGYTIGVMSGEPLIYVSSDGENWAPVPGGPVGGSTCKGVRSLRSHNGRLYAGTDDPVEGGRVFETAGELSICRIAGLESMAKITVLPSLEWLLKRISEKPDFEEMHVPDALGGLIASIVTALDEGCLALGSEGIRKRALAYLDVARLELGETSYQLISALTARGKTIELGHQELASTHCERAADAMRRFIVTIEDVTES